MELIVARPAPGERTLLESAEVTVDRGLIGDGWSTRAKEGDPSMQVTLMNARASALISDGDDRRRWAEAGDQLYVDFDLSEENLPVDARIAVGAVVLEVSDVWHKGCGKFAKRFGVEALRLARSDEGRELRVRGLMTTVVSGGAVALGDPIRRLD